MKSNIVIASILIFLSLLTLYIWNLRIESAIHIREADRFNIPVIEEMMQKLPSWKFDDIRPLLGKKFIKALTENEFQEELDVLSILGNLESHKMPRHVRHNRYKHWLYGQCAINKYTVSSLFEKGKANVMLKLNHCNTFAEITHFQITSKALPRKPAWK